VATLFNWRDIDKYREGNGLECYGIEAEKVAGGLPDSLWETYSALANTKGGLILLGVEELPDRSFKPVGVPDPEKLVQDFWDLADNRKKVSLNILFNWHIQIVEVDGMPYCSAKHTPSQSPG
jgi:predicted HTH transcriptional regulator